MNTHLEHSYEVRDSKCSYVNEYRYDESTSDVVDEVTLRGGHCLSVRILKIYVFILPCLFRVSPIPNVSFTDRSERRTRATIY